MRIRVIACGVLSREVCLCAAHSRNAVSLTFLKLGLHSNSDLLRAEVQREIDSTDSEKYQAVAIAYGLCSNGIAGLRAGSVPLVAPRAHDCITLVLGSKEKYARIFSEHPGTYYYPSGWIEQDYDTSIPLRPSDGAGLMIVAFEELVAKYGKENAEYLWEIQSGWYKNYSNAVYINTGLGNIAEYRAHVQALAEQNGWTYSEMEGNLSLLQALVDGDWDEDRFLTVSPGETVLARVDCPMIIGAGKASAAGGDSSLP